MTEKQKTKSKPKKKIKRKILGVIAVLVLIGYLSDRVYYNRYAKLFYDFATTGGQLGDYSPLDNISGNAETFLAGTPEDVGIDPAKISEARDYAEQNNSSAFLIWKNDKLIEETYFGDTTRNTTLISRSLAKPFMAVAIGRAIELGKVKSLDQPVADFIPKWKEDPERSQILVRHLLDNRTGLLAQQPVYGPFEIRNKSYLHPRHEDILINKYPLTNTPGERYDYSQANGDLVALIIEAATGERYADFISKEIFEKIGAQGGSIWVNRKGGVAHSGCCMLIPAEDVLRLAVLLLKNGKWGNDQLLSPEFVNEMRTGTEQNPYAGLSVYLAGKYVERRGFANPDGQFTDYLTIHREPYLAEDLFLFDGNAHQVVYIIPSADLVILRMGLKTPNEPEFDNTIIPNLILSGIDPETLPVPLVAQRR